MLLVVKNWVYGWFAFVDFHHNGAARRRRPAKGKAKDALSRHYDELRSKYDRKCDEVRTLAQQLAEAHEGLRELDEESQESDAPIVDAVPTITGTSDMDWMV
jgi:uncharacterized protein involved in exopolysaccharide biosynthesis